MEPWESTLQFNLTPDADDPLAGDVKWTALVYGPSGVTADGLTLTPSGTNGEQVSLTIGAGVIGTVTLQVSYLSTNGLTVIGTEGVVENRYPGALTGIELRPSVISTQAGADAPLAAWGTFDAGDPCALFVVAGEMAFASSDENIATVDSDGKVSLLAEGNATITATYQGTHAATCAMTVLGPMPTITSSTSVNAIFGTPVSYQITASGTPTEYSATGLADGLVVDTATGLVSGTPTANGAFVAQIGATNSAGTGRTEVTFLVDPGSNQSPSHIGLGAAAIPANQPGGTLVGVLSASDPNPADTVFSYTLVSGDGSGDNALFAISGGSLVTTASINPATHPICNVRVRCTDASGLWVEQTFALPVLGAPVITTQPKSVQTMVGDDIRLIVEVEGLAPLSYVWSQDGVVADWLESSPSVSLYAGDWAEGQWTVTVANEFGSATSDAATVTVDPQSYGWWA